MDLKLLPYVINLINSMIGVSILSMPYCFQQCGFLMAIVMQAVIGYCTTLSSLYLVKVAISNKKASYELLALSIFGRTGKLVIELSMSGVMIGTLVAFYVIMGELGPEILYELFGLKPSSHIRVGLLIVLTGVVVLPLSLLRNVTSLSNVSAASILFYIFLVSYVILRSVPSIIEGTNIKLMNWWRFSGIFKCIPIFAMGTACQTQVFVLYNALPEPSVSAVKEVVKKSLVVVIIVYIVTGFCGYLTFAHQSLTGDILTMYHSGTIMTIIKMGFLLSVAISFPLMMFPCRESIYSLVYLKIHPKLEAIPEANYIPDEAFRGITCSVVGCTLLTGILIPNVELVLALTGAVTGTIVCYILPGMMYLATFPGPGRHMARAIVALGLIVLVVSTVTTLRQDVHPVELMPKPKGTTQRTSTISNRSNPQKSPLNLDEVKKGNIDIKKPPDAENVQESRKEPANPDKPALIIRNVLNGKKKSENDSVQKEKLENLSDHKVDKVKRDTRAVPDDAKLSGDLKSVKQRKIDGKIKEIFEKRNLNNSLKARMEDNSSVRLKDLKEKKNMSTKSKLERERMNGM